MSTEGKERQRKALQSFAKEFERIWDYLFKRRRSWSQAQLQEVYQSFSLEVLLKDLHHNGDAFLEDHMGLRWLEQSEEDPLVYQTGHRDDRNSPKCIIGKVQIIKNGKNLCLSCLEEQRLVALLQGSIESDDSPASGGDEEKGEQAQVDNRAN